MAEKDTKKAVRAAPAKATKKPTAAALKPVATAKKGAPAAKPAESKAAPKKTAAPAKASAPAKRAVARPATRTAVRRAEPAREAPERTAPRERPAPRPLPTAPAGQVPLIAADGSASGAVALPASLAAVRKGLDVVFQAYLTERANARQGNAATRNRTRVKGGGAKPWRQKGTGRARQGSTRSPQWRHGAVVFGPNGRVYSQRIPEKMRKLAFAASFASRAAEGRVLVFERLPQNGDRPRTRAVVDWLDAVGDTGKTLVVAGGIDERFERAAANLPDVAVRTPGTLRLTDLLDYDTLLVARQALDALASRAGGEPAEVPA